MLDLHIVGFLTLTTFELLVLSDFFSAQQKMVKNLIFLILSRIISHISRKTYMARFFPRAFLIYWFNVFGGTPARLGGLGGTFWLKKFSADMVFFRRRKFELRCITSNFGIFKMCTYFFYKLTCFLVCNKR